MAQKQENNVLAVQEQSPTKTKQMIGRIVPVSVMRVLWRPRLRLALAAALNLVPSLAAFLYIRAFGVNVPFWDEFQLVPYIAALQSRTLTFQSLFALHNENRIFFPRLVMLATAHLTHFNSKAEMYLYWLCLCLICGLFLIAFTALHGLTYRSLLLFAPFTFVLFSLRQWENLLWGWEICWGMAAFFLVLALYLLQSRSRATVCFVLALLSGVIASFSLLSGLLVWPVGLLELWYLIGVRAGHRWWWQRCGAWLSVGAAVFVVYFHGFARASYVPSPPPFLQQPQPYIRYFLAAVGAPLSVEVVPALAFGALLCILILAVLWRIRARATRSLDMSLAVATLGFLSAGVLVVGRSGYGVDQALSSRYTVFGLIGIGALYLYMVTQFSWRHPLEALAGAAMLCMLLFGVAVGYTAGLSEGQTYLSSRRAQANLIRSYAMTPYAALGGLTPGGTVTFTLPQLVYMNTEGLNVFSDSKGGLSPKTEAFPANMPKSGSAAGLGIDQINEAVLPPNGSTVVVGPATEDVFVVIGWAVDSAGEHPASGVFIDVDGQIQMPAIYGFDRPDVADLFKNNSYGQTGFQAAFSARQVGLGRHILRFRVLSTDRSRYYEPDYQIALEVR